MSGEQKQMDSFEALQRISEVLWPDGFIDHHWSPDTLDAIADIVRDKWNGVRAIRGPVGDPTNPPAVDDDKLSKRVDELWFKCVELQDRLDLSLDEFLRIKAIPGASAEILGICERAGKNIRQTVPLIDQRDKLLSSLKWAIPFAEFFATAHNDGPTMASCLAQAHRAVATVEGGSSSDRLCHNVGNPVCGTCAE